MTHSWPEGAIGCWQLPISNNNWGDDRKESAPFLPIEVSLIIFSPNNSVFNPAKCSVWGITIHQYDTMPSNALIWRDNNVQSIPFPETFFLRALPHHCVQMMWSESFWIRASHLGLLCKYLKQNWSRACRGERLPGSTWKLHRWPRRLLEF